MYIRTFETDFIRSTLSKSRHNKSRKRTSTSVNVNAFRWLDVTLTYGLQNVNRLSVRASEY